MTMPFFDDLVELKRRILTLGTLAEESLSDAVQALDEQNRELAEVVIDSDGRIDALEVGIEAECHKLLALYQPVAADLRLIVAVLKINGDLERIGDLCVNVAERAIALSDKRHPAVAFNFTQMAELVRGMLRRSLDALVRVDAARAREVCAADAEVDARDREMYALVRAALPRRRSLEGAAELIHVLSAAHHLERIADHAVNIAREVIYMAEGTIARHGSGEAAPGAPDPRPRAVAAVHA